MPIYFKIKFNEDEFQDKIRFSFLSYLPEIKIARINPCVCMCVCVCGRGFIPWVFEPEIFNLIPLGITLQVTSTVAYSVKEAGQT